MLGSDVLVMLGVLGVARAQLPDVMKDVTLGFGQALEQCRQQSELTEDMMQEFFHFWSDGFKFERREVGCAIHCMAQHYNLLTDSSRMHRDNTHAFINSFPNGEMLAHKMTELIHECEQRHHSTEDHCWRVLRTAECFKRACVRAGLAPSVQLIIAEIIMEAEP